jgi:pre-mRNA-splicing helicase BRR2
MSPQARCAAKDACLRVLSSVQVQSLVGRTTGQRMGDRYLRTQPEDIEKRKAKRAKMEAKRSERKASRLHGSTLSNMVYERRLIRVADDILSRSEDTAGYYRPKTNETQRVYEMLLTFITENIGSQPRDVVASAADDVLQIMKNDSMQVQNYDADNSLIVS